MNIRSIHITIFIEDTFFSFELINEFCFINDNIEICTARLKILNYSYVISVTYRPHSKHVAVNEFTTIANQIISNEIFRCSKTLLLGEYDKHKITFRIINNSDKNLFTNELSKLNWNDLLSSPNVNENFNTFYNNYYIMHVSL